MNEGKIMIIIDGLFGEEGESMGLLFILLFGAAEESCVSPCTVVNVPSGASAEKSNE